MNKEYRVVAYLTYIPYEQRHFIKDGCVVNGAEYEYMTMNNFHNLCHPIDLTNHRTIDLTIYQPECNRLGDVYIVTEYMIESCLVNDNGEWLDTLNYIPAYHYSFDESKDGIKIQEE